jgi:sugar phosphate isomerase/epimerase
MNEAQEPSVRNSRRNFLKATTAVASLAGAALPNVLPAGEAKPKSKGIALGVNMEFVRHADKSFEWGAKKAAEMGYRYIEPCFLMGCCLLSNAGYCHVQSLDLDPEYFKNFCNEHKLKLSGLSSHSDLLDTRIGVEYARKGIMYARALADRGLFDTQPVVQICETMFPPKWMTPEDAYGVIKMNLRPILECCADNGVYLGVEPHGPYTAHKKSMVRIMELIDSPWLRVNFDTGNSYLAGEDPYEFLQAILDKLIHLHAKDISVKQSDAERGKVAGTAVGCACGDGVIDWAKVIRMVGKERSIVFSVECGTVEQAERSLKHLTSLL